uniref:Uncharacterized protein n=1 Tax=Haplochromis burtoni TaxID=8153 RepID=A0A3Q2X6N7_HAPBU
SIFDMQCCEKSFHPHHSLLLCVCKCGCDSLMLWGCFAASGPMRLALIEEKNYNYFPKKILQDNCIN